MRFKRINYADTVQQTVFERMISERQRIAEMERGGKATLILSSDSEVFKYLKGER